MIVLKAWFLFAAASAVIGVSGYWLSKLGNEIAERTGIGSTLIGVLLMATVTSVPEVISGVSSVTLIDSPDIAVGGTIGSCAFNLTLLVLLEALYRKSPIYDRVSSAHIVCASLSIVMIGLVALGIAMNRSVPDMAILGFISPVSIALVAVYIVSVVIITRHERSSDHHPPPGTAITSPKEMPLRILFLCYAIAAVFVIASGTYLPVAAQNIAEVMSWRETFVGTIMVAASTSIPELVVTIFCARLGNLNMAVANVLGSNLFDAAIIAIIDFFYLKGSIFADVSQAHAITAVSAMIMTATVIVSLQVRVIARPFWIFGWPSAVIMVAYVLSGYLLFLFENGH